MPSLILKRGRGTAWKGPSWDCMTWARAACSWFAPSAFGLSIYSLAVTCLALASYLGLAMVTPTGGADAFSFFSWMRGETIEDCTDESGSSTYCLCLSPGVALTWLITPDCLIVLLRCRRIWPSSFDCFFLPLKRPQQPLVYLLSSSSMRRLWINS